MIAHVFFTPLAGRCAGCGQSHHFWVNHGGKTVCVSCEPAVLEAKVKEGDR